ncbi:hypothetical protein [Clostridium beijerinckii]|uniref:hypothetical protein n=1 Tax=Clostridium beijerinckii TaxID=1520 RepID=UPI00232CD170|nr:hypothetical protein [Clostridium beijerinckii]
MKISIDIAIQERDKLQKDLVTHNYPKALYKVKRKKLDFYLGYLRLYGRDIY